MDGLQFMQEDHVVTEEDEQQPPLGQLQRRISELSELQLRYTYSNASSASEFSLYESSGDQFESKFIREDQLYSQLQEALQTIQQMLCLDDLDLCLYLFHHYHWDQEQLTTHYFNDHWESLTAHTQGETIGVLAACPVCLQEELLFSSGWCPHAYCQPCWQSYITAELTKGHLHFGCMQEPSCPRAPILRSFIERIAPACSDLLRRKTCISFAVQDRNISYCPSESCHLFCVKPQMMEIPTVTCPCSQIYCFRCRQEPHHPLACAQLHRWQALLNSDHTNHAWLAAHTRPCPACRQPIEKKVGCSKMKCLCSAEFCYECGKNWDGAHAEAKTQCPSRGQLAKREADNDRFTQLQKKLEELVAEAERNRAALLSCEQLVQDQVLKGRVAQLRTQVVSAWMALKWGKVWLWMQGRGQVEQQLQAEYMGSIRSVMQPVELILKSYKGLALKELHYYGEQVLQRKELLRRNQKIWLEAWEATS